MALWVASNKCARAQVLFQDGSFQWQRLENLLALAKEGSFATSLDLSATARDAVRVMLVDDQLRTQLIAALTEDNRLHVDELRSLLALVEDEIDLRKIGAGLVQDVPSLARSVALSWSDRVLSA